MARDLIDAILVLVSILVTIQSSQTLYLTLYTWNQPRSEASAPAESRPPGLSFTVMLRCRQEEAVIQAPMGGVAGANYPPQLIQVLVVCSADDGGTIGKAEEKIDALRREGMENVSLVVFHDCPVNKPHALNCALPHAANDVVTIFDAAADLHPAISNGLNTVMR